MKQHIEIVYHIAILGNWYEIVQEQLALLESSGLGSAADRITVSVVGEVSRDLLVLLANTSFFGKVKFIYKPDLSAYEFPSIEAVRQIAREYPEARILYFHTKGASHSSHVKSPEGYLYTPKQIHNYKQWRRFMEYFVIERYQDCLRSLRTFDTCGVDWLSPKDSQAGRNAKFRPHFSGNFWWATGRYINRCTLAYHSRYECEMFIGTGNPRVKNLYSSFDNRAIKKLHTIGEAAQLEDKEFKAVFNVAKFDFANYYFEEAYYRGEPYESLFLLRRISMGQKSSESITVLADKIRLGEMSKPKLLELVAQHFNNNQKLVFLIENIEKMKGARPRGGTRR
ncbi:MAG: hypothetical protein FWF59_10735 [Turicibacter sp.]|nr:hypothetical protein [Turicibacter sp.]